MQELRQSTEMKVRVGSAVDATDGVSPETGLTLGAADQAELLKHNGAATVDISAATFAAVTAVDGWYDLTLTASHTDTLGQLTVVIQDSSLMAPIFRDFMVVAANHWDSKYSTDKIQVDITQLLGNAIATPTVNGVLEVDLTHMGGVAQSAADLKHFADWCYDPATGFVSSNLVSMVGSAQTVTDLSDFANDGYNPVNHKVQGVVLTDTCTTNSDLVSAAAVVNEWETQSQADPTGFHVNVKEVNGTAQTANDNSTDINAILIDTAEIGAAGAGLTALGDTRIANLDTTISTRAPASEYDGDLEDIRTLLGDGGDIFYVSKTGDNSDGTTWAKAKNTIDSAIALCTADHCDRIYIGCGTYDETSATAGVTCDVAGIKIFGAMPGVTVKNTNTTNGSKVFSITVDNVWLHNMSVTKGETTSDNAICIDVNGSYISADIRDVTITVEKATHTGVRFTGGAVGSGYVNGPMALSYIYSAAGVGTGIEAADCNNCVAIDAQFHTLTTGIKFTGGANCHDNMVSPYAMISSCTVGISLTSGCINNMLSALILNCTDEYDDNSGNNTNKTDGSLTYILDDIKTHVDNGFDGVEGSGFNTATDSLEALRNRGDAAWITATGFNTTVPDVAGTAAGLHTTTDGKVDAIQTDTTAIKAKTDNLPDGIKKNSAYTAFTFLMVNDTDHVTGQTSLTVAGSYSGDGGAVSSLTNTGAITEISNGLYEINLTAGELNYENVTLIFTASGADARVITIHTSS